MHYSLNFHRSFIVAATVLSLAFFAARTADAAAYIRFVGLKGEAQDKDHKGWSDLGSFSQEIYIPGANSTIGRTNARAVQKPMVFKKELDRISPKLAEALLTGKVFTKVTIHVTASYTDVGRVTYYSYELENVRVVKYNISGSGQAEDVPGEEFALSFEKITVTYTENDNAGRTKGKVVYSWPK